MIIGAGALVFLIAICGCLGAVMENRCLLVLVSYWKGGRESSLVIGHWISSLRYAVV